ncbi:MAG: hypothetical protein ACK55Z_18630, partial [bacterium]
GICLSGAVVSILTDCFSSPIAENGNSQFPRSRRVRRGCDCPLPAYNDHGRSRRLGLSRSDAGVD